MSGNVYFWQGCVNQAEFKDYAVEIEKLLSGEAPIEKLKNHKVYSARFSLKGRILFTFLPVKKKQCLLLLEILPNHEYENARFLKKNVLKKYLEKNKARLTDELVFESIDQTKLPKFQSKEKINYVTAHYYNHQFIVLDDTQHSALLTDTPVVISGHAGSGKSCILYGALQRILEHYPADETKDILFVAESTKLVGHMKQMWAEQEEVEKNHQRVKFLSYDEMLNELSNERLSASNKVGEDYFQDWFKDYKKRAMRNSPHDIWSDVLAIYHECRVISGYIKENGPFSRQDYFNSVGKKQSLFCHHKERLIAVYDDYMTYLSSRKQWDPAFYQLNTHDKYYAVVVDEALDLSVGQWATLLTLAQDSRIYYATDSHQMVKDRLSHRPLLFSLLQNTTDKVVSHVKLKQNYRCPNDVIRLVNIVISTKNELTRGVADPYEISHIELSDHKEIAHDVVEFNEATVIPEKKDVVWCEPSKQEDHELTKAPLSSDYMVITSARHKEAARQRYNDTPLVFTPIEAKGLQYPYVIVFNLLDSTDEICEQANKSLGSMPENIPTYSHQSKDEQNNRRYCSLFNDLIIAFTRATEKLYFVQEKEHKLTNILDRLVPGFPLQSTVINLNIDTEDDTSEKWLEHAITLYRNGNAMHAQDILARICLKSADEISEIETAYTVKTNTTIEQEPTDKFGLTYKIKGLYNKLTADTLMQCYRMQDDLSWLVEKKAEQTVSILEWVSNDPIRTKTFHDSLQKFKKGKQVKAMVSKLVGDLNLAHKAAKENNAGFITFIHGLGVNLNECDKDKKTPLYYAVKEGHTASVLALYQAEVDIDTPTQTNVPLHVAVEFQQLSMVRQLIRLGVSKTISSYEGEALPSIVADELKAKAFSDSSTNTLTSSVPIDGDVPPLLTLPPSATSPTKPLDVFFKELLLKFNATNVERWLKMKNGVSHIYRVVTEDDFAPAPLLERILDNPVRKEIFCEYLKHCEPSLKTTLLAEIHSKTFLQNNFNAVHFAALFDCEELIKLFMEQCFSLTCSSARRETPLYLAMMQGHVRIVNLLQPVHLALAVPILDNKPHLTTGLNLPLFSAFDLSSKEIMDGLNHYRLDNPDAPWNPVAYLNGNTALLNAVHYNNFDSVESILQDDVCDINAVAGENDTTPLSLAVQWGLSDIVDILLSFGADPNQALNDGTTPLLIAAQQGDTEICRQLLEAEADASLCAHNGCSPLLAAVNFGHLDVVALLFSVNYQMLFCKLNLDGKKICLYETNLVNYYPWLAEDLKIERNKAHKSLELYRALLHNKHSSLNNIFSNQSQVYFLIAKSPDYPNGILSYILQNPHYELVFCDFLRQDIKRNGLPNSVLKKMERDIFYWNDENMVHAAAYENAVKFINLLHEFNVCVDKRSKRGVRPIFYAIKNGHLEAVEALLKAGAVFGEQSYSLLHCAIDERQPHIIAWLGGYATAEKINVSIERGDTPLTRAVMFHDEMVVQALINSNPLIDLNLPRKLDGITALHLAVINGKLGVVRLLLSNKAIVDCERESDGVTPLMLAVIHHQIDMIMVLINAGANPNKPARDNETAFSIAAKTGFFGFFEIAPKSEIDVEHAKLSLDGYNKNTN